MLDRESQLLDLIATTRAIRRYRPDPIPDDDLARMFFVATRAPSGSNLQSFRFIVLRDDSPSLEARQVLERSYRDQWPKSAAAAFIAERAGGGSERAKRLKATMDGYVANFSRIPVIVLACLVSRQEPRFQDGASLFPACENLLLAARILGYGGVLTQWHWPVQNELRGILSIPADAAIGCIMTFGTPLGSHGRLNRKPVGQLVYEGQWGKSPSWASDDPLTTSR